MFGVHGTVRRGSHSAGTHSAIRRGICPGHYYTQSTRASALRRTHTRKVPDDHRDMCHGAYGRVNPRTGRIVRSLLAGILIACGVGIGAANPWWAAVVFGTPPIVGGVLLVPAATGRSELPRFRRAFDRVSVPVRVDAMTRSSLRTGADQPTLVSALVAPPGDTPYQARWITSMHERDARALVADPVTAIPPHDLPRRSATTPEFDDYPGPSALLYASIAVVTALVAVFAVPEDVWRVDGPDLSLPRNVGAGSSPAGDDADRTLGYPERRRRLADRIGTVGPSAGANLLGVWFDRGGSDRAEIYDPATGQAVTVHYINGVGWADPRREATDKRGRDTFDLSELMSADIGTMAAAMETEAVKVDPAATIADLDMRRPDRDGDPRWQARFTGSNLNTIEATADGIVAQIFDPGDLAVSFDLIHRALRSAKVPFGSTALTRFEIRGTAKGTPILFAGSIQNSGGVYVEYRLPRRSGSIVLAPGELPRITSRATTSTAPGDFSVDDVSRARFEAVRDDAMRRGRVDAFDRNAVNLLMWSTFQRDGSVRILVQLTRDDASAGTYSPDGRFLRAGVR